MLGDSAIKTLKINQTIICISNKITLFLSQKCFYRKKLATIITILATTFQ